MNLQQAYWHPRPRCLRNVPFRDDVCGGIIANIAQSPMTVREVHGNKVENNVGTFCSRLLKRTAQKRPQSRNRPTQRLKEPFYDTDHSQRSGEPQFVLSEPLFYPIQHSGNNTEMGNWAHPLKAVSDGTGSVI